MINILIFATECRCRYRANVLLKLFGIANFGVVDLQKIKMQDKMFTRASTNKIISQKMHKL